MKSMKKIILSLVFLLGMLCFVSCGDTFPTVTELELSGQKTEFVVGDAFSKGDLKVVAKYSDESEKDVTAEANVDAPKSLSAAGTYAVIVSFGGQSAAYQVNVVLPAENPVDPELALNIVGTKLTYVVGESLDTTGLVVYEIKGEKLEKVELSACTFEVLNDKGEKVESFTTIGSYEVKVSYNDQTVSYNVKVGAKGYETIEEAIDSAVANANNVKYGSAVIGLSGNENAYAYEFGQNCLNVIFTSEYYTENAYYQLEEDGSVFGVTVDEQGNASLVLETTEESLKGVSFSSVINYAAQINGIESLIDYLFEQSQSEEAKLYFETIDYCVSCGNPSRYSFSYLVIENGQVKAVSVEFSLSEKGSVTDSYVIIDVYYSEESLEKDEEGNIIGLSSLFAEADYTYSVGVYQEDGERTFVNEHTASKYLLQGFDATVDGSDVNGATLAMEKGGALNIVISNFTPETASTDVDQIKVEITDADGNSTWNAYGSYYDGVVNIGAYVLGTYKVTISSAKVSKTFTLNVTAPTLSSFEAGVNINGEVTASSQATAYIGSGLVLGAAVNQFADASFEATLVSGDSSATLVSDSSFTTCTFTATVEGTYEVKLTSKVNPDLTSTIVITVTEAPKVTDLVVGTWVYDAYSQIFTYVINADGTYSVSVDDWGNVTNYNYLYTIDGTTVTCTSTDGTVLDGMNDYVFTLVGGTQLFAAYGDGWEIGFLTKVESDDVSGDYIYVTTNKFGMEIESSVTLNSDGTGSYSITSAAGMYQGEFTWELADGVLTFSNVTPLYDTEAIELSGTLADGAITLTYGEETNVFTK